MSHPGQESPRELRFSVPAQAFDLLYARAVASNGHADQLELRIHVLEPHINLIETTSCLLTKRGEALGQQLDSMSLLLEKDL